MTKTHRLSKTKTYNIWKTIRQRCRNPNNPSYPNYGGRGIKVCKRWDDYLNFLADMGERPSDAHEISRVDNDGDYTPANTRWSTDSVEQARNRRKIRVKKTTSKYRGVGWRPNQGWRARITITQGDTRHLGWFDTEKEAALAYDAAARHHKGFHLNFPRKR